MKLGHLRRGFTLIELLVVIAIIGILSSVVLASLNTARTKGNYAAVKSNLSTIQTQAELDYDAAPNSYGTVTSAGTCGGTGMFADNTILGAVASARSAGGTMSCNTNGTAYVVWSTTSGATWCIDSRGVSTTTIPGSSSATSCY
ncbi:MAG TPA: type II secretion system protein [Candidatus Paceibacterota bacterium]